MLSSVGARSPVATKNTNIVDAPAYPHREAVRLTGLSYGTLYSWTHGRSPIIRLAQRGPRVAFWSFTNIVEAKVIRSMRDRHNLRLDAIRKAVRYVEREFEVPHPLATELFKTDGVELFVEKYGALLNVSREGQTAMRDLMENYLRQIDYAENRAVRLFIDDARVVVIDPRVGFGRPVISGTRVPVVTIGERFKLGESIESLADDFEIELTTVQEAVRVAMPFLAHVA